MSKNFKKTGENLFCHSFIIDGALAHTNQFLKKLDETINFEQYWLDKLLAAYKGKASLGAPPYKPTLMLKLLFLSYLFNVSEREIERIVNDSISMKVFLGISLDEAAPDHSSITKFKDRILLYEEFNDRNIFEDIFNEIILLAQEKGINLGITQSIDSTHTIANVNTKKDKERQDEDKKPPRDPSARWGVKRVKIVKTIDGKGVKIKESYYGFKSHLSVNTKTDLITSLKVSTMNRYDGHFFEPLMKDDLKKGVAIPNETIYTADRAYDDGELHSWLYAFKLKNAILLKGNEEQVKKKKKTFLYEYTSDEEYESASKQRYVVERVNGDLKEYHSLRRSRYLGLSKMNIQTLMSSMAHNLKIIVKQVTGVGLRSPATFVNVS